MNRIDEYQTADLTFKITYRPQSRKYEAHCVSGAVSIFLVGNYPTPIAAKQGCNRFATVQGPWIRGGK